MTIESKNIQRFRTILEDRLGLHFDDSHVDQLREVLTDRLRVLGLRDVGLYLDRLALPLANGVELAEIAAKLTVAETYFFRHPDHFLAFTETALPQRLDGQRESRRLRMLSAGCASGEEAYTLAMLVRDRVPDLSSWDVKIHGIDINKSLIEKAMVGQYTEWSLRATPPSRRQRSFRAAGREYVVEDAVRSMVCFEARNLLDDDQNFWQPERFDIIFFRNVAIYFAPETTKTVIARLARSLVPGGFLFLGPSETLRGVSNEFHLRHTQETFYYQKRREDEPAAVAGMEHVPSAPAQTLPAAVLLNETEQDGSWVEAIGRASAKIASLASKSQAQALHDDKSPAAPEVRAAAGVTSAPGSLAMAWELLRAEQYDQASEALNALPPAWQTSAETLLLRAVVLTNAGRIIQAQEVCRRVLAADELNACAHYLTALCLEHAGNPTGAMQHDQTAVYLDPNFAMPHLHLGLLARRRGDLETARRELNQAATLLEREAASNILLFGGGFSREALIQLSRAELRACGGAA